jgi:hypothetical protein
VFIPSLDRFIKRLLNSIVKLWWGYKVKGTEVSLSRRGAYKQFVRLRVSNCERWL